MKSKMRFLGNVIWKMGDGRFYREPVSDRWIGQMYRTHGVPCSCPMHSYPPIQRHKSPSAEEWE